MENKSNSLNRIKRHQREKVLRFSIRKYSFGAASVAIAALMFLGARVVSADTVSGSSSPSTAGVVQPNDKGDSPVGIKDENKSEVANNSLENKEVALVENSSNTVDKSQLRTVVEELNSLLSTKLNLDDSVLSSVKERVQRAQALLDKADAVQKDINELKELLSADLATLSNAVKESSEVRESNTGTEAEKPANQSSPEVRASEESQTVSAKKDSLKLSVDQLQAAISEVPEHDTTKEVLEKANEVMVLAQGVLQNTTVSLTDVEQMNKLVKRMFNSVKNATLRLSSGSHDPRNGQRMTQGTGERAAAVSSRWTNQDNLLSYQRFRATDENGRVRNDDRQFTENKVDMTARIETIDGVKYAVYDIFFNNDGKSMVRLSRQQLYNVILPPKILDLQSSGAYKSDTIRDLHFDTYRRNNQNESGTLSQNPDKFTYESTQNFHFLNDNGQSKGNLTYFYNLGVRQSGRSYDQDMKDYFKNNKNDPFLKKAVALDGVNKSWSYGIGVRTNNPTAAVHMHFKAKLRSDVTDEAVKKAFILAIAGTYGETTNQSYVFGSGKNDNENVEPTVKQSAKYPISGREVTKKVDAPLGDLDKPVDAGFVTGNNNFPTDIRWSWPDGKPNTTTAGVFRYKVKAQYSDNTSNTTDAILKVLPNKPEIDQKSVNEKAGKTGQTVTVNVGKGVPDNSTVTLYSGNTVIGTGNTKGTTATITVSKALPSTAITAKTTVKNNGTVESEFSAPVTPTEVPDKAAPTVLINGKKLTENADDNRFIIYRGANFNPTFRVQDDKSNHVNLSITGLPNGVANVTTSGGKEFNYTIPDNTVANEAPFGESIASVVASDGRNSATYKFKYRIVDIQAKNSTTENRALGSALGDPHDHFKVAESNTVENDKYYPTGMQFKWIELNRSTITTTDVPNTTNLNELGNVTKYFATAVFPAVKNTKEIDRVNYTIYSPKQKAIPITFNVTDNVKPTVKLVGDNGSDTTLSESTPEANLPKVTVYRGEKANVTIKASDNTGKIKELRGSGMPNGIWFNKNPNANSEVWLSSDNATETNPLSHTITGVVEKDNRIEEKTVTINASDKADPSNVTTVKFKMVVKEQKDKYTPTAGTTPVAVNNIGSISTSDLDKIKNSVTVPNLSPEATQDGGVTKTLKDNGRVTVKNGKNYVTVEVTYPDRSKDEVPVEVQQNTNVQKQPTIYVVKGETISNEELRKFVYLPNGAQKEELPSTATVTATLDTATKGSKTTNVTVTFQGSTPVVVPVTYEVIQNFPVANKVYDFAGVSRGNGASDYYVNQGLRQGMSWFVEKETVEGGQKVFKKVSNDNNMNSQIASDITAGVGEYRYKLGAKFREGRFTNQAEEASRLSYSGEIVHTVYDVVANTTKVEATYGSTLTNSQAQSAVMKATNSQNLPTGTTYEWVANALGAVATNLTVSTYGEETRYVKVTLPKTREAGPDSAAATQVNPFKVIEVKVKVNETVKPTVKLVSDNGDVTLSESTPEANLPKVTVYRGEKANVTIKASDNTGKIKELRGSGMPNGIWFNKNPNANSEVWLSSDNATETNPLSHTITGVVEKGNRIEEKIVTIKATDKTEPSNVTTVKFKMVVKEQKDKYTPTAGTTVKVGNIGTISQPDGDKIKNSVTVPNLSPEATQDGGVTKTLKDNGRVTVKNGKNYVTVEVTYPDRSKDEVDVAVEEVLKAGEKNPTNKAVDGQPYISNEKVINPNKEDATFTATRTNGLTVGTEGKVTGIPTGITWTGNETEKIVKIPVTVTRTGETPVNVEISVVVQRDVTKTPTFTVGTQDPTTGNVDVTVSGVPNGTKVKLPGVKGEKVVTDGKVTLPNDELPETPQTGKGSAQEEGKLPKEGTSDITIPKKLVESGTPTFTVGTQDPTTGNVDVTVSGVPNGTKVKLPGVKGEKVVTDGKVTLPNDELPDTPQTGKGSAQEEGKLPKEGTSDITIPKKLVESGTPTFTVGTQDPTTGNVDVTVSGVPNGTKVKLPGVKGEKVVTDGKVTLPNDELPETPQTGKGSAQEEGKLPKEGTSDITIPKKLVESGTPTFTVGTQDPTTGNVDVTVSGVPNGTKVKLPGVKGEKVVTDGKVTLPNDELPETPQTGKGSAQEEGKLPKEGTSDITIPKKLVESGTPTFTVGTQDPTTGNVDVTVSGVPNGTKVKLPGVKGEKVVTDGKVTLSNDELPETPQTGKGSAQEEGKLPKEGTSDITIPKKLVENGTPTFTVGTQDPTTGNVDVTVSGVPNGTKVKLPGVKGEKVVTDGKVTLPNDELPETPQTGKGSAQEEGKLPKEGTSDITIPKKLVESGTPTFTVGTQDPTTGNVDVTVSGVPNGTKVKLPGVKGEKVVTDGKVTLPNDELPDTPQTGKGSAQEEGKLPKEGTSDITIPKKLVESGTPTFTVGTQDPTTGNVDVTVSGVPNGTKVKLPGVKGEKVVTDGKVTLPNDELPDTPQTGKGSAQEEGKLPKEGTSDITIPKKLVENGTPTFTVGTQDPTTGNVDVTVSGVPNGTKVKLPGVKGEKVVTDGKVTLPNDELPETPQTGKGSAQEEGKLPKEGTSDITIPKKLVESGTPTFTVGTQDPTTGNVDVTVSGVPNGTKVKLPGVKGEKVVTDGKVTLPNDELPETPQTGKGSAQEEGKLPKEGTSDITIPKKLVESGTPTFTVGTQDPTTGNVDVTVSGVPNGTKVKLPGVKGEKVVTDGKVTLPNDELPETPQTGKGSAQEEGKLPKEGTSDITIPKKLVESGTPTFTVGTQDPTTGNVDVTVSGVPNGTKVKLPGVKGEKVVTDGKVTLPNDELPETPQTGKGSAQEEGKLPKEGTSDITIPKKLVENGTPTFTVGTQDPTTGNVDVTVSGVPNGTKVKLPGVKGEKVVTDGKVTLPNDELPETPQTGKGSAQEEGKLPKEGTSDITIPKKLVESGTPTFTVGTQDPTTGNVDVTVSGVPNGTKVKLPGVKGEKVVTDGKVTLPNDELPETPQTGKGSAQEEGKLPKEGTSDITIPKKLVESGTPTFTVGTQDPTTGNVDVTVSGVPNGTKVKLPGVKGEKVVTDGKVTLSNDELPETPQTGKGSAQEEGKLPKEGTSDITIPKKLVENGTPTFTVGTQDPTTGNVDVTVSGVPNGTKVKLPGVKGEKVVTDGKVTLPNDELPETPQTGKGSAQEEGKLPKEGTSDITIPKKLVESGTPTFTVGTQDPTTGNVDVTVSGVPNGTKVKLPGVKGEKVVTDGKVTLPNDELPETPQTGKGSAQEEGKLPKEGTSDITIPKKLVESGTPTFTVGTQDPTTGNVDVTVSGVPNGTKVKLPGVKGEKVVTDGKVTLPNDELPETPQTGKGSAQEEGKLPKEGTSDITIPKKLVESGTPTFTVGTQDPTTGNVDVTVSGVPNGTKVKLPGVKGEKVVTDGKVTLSNDELPETPQTGKGSAQEEGKLPKEGTSDITIPKKLVENGTPTFTVGTQDPTTGNVDVTVSGVPNGTKVKLPGVKGEKVVTDGKVTLPNDELPETPQTGKGSAQEEGKLPKEGTSDITIPKKLVESGTPTFTVGTQDPTTGNVDVTVSGVPNGTKVKLPGVKGEKVVTDGKVTLPNDELPDTPQTGKGSAQEEGKLPKEGTSDITIPKKLVESGTPTFTVGTQDPTTGNVDVTVSGVPNGTKVKLPGVKGEKVVTDGKVTLPNDELPETPQTGKGSAQEEGKLPKEGTSDITIPKKLVESGTPTFTVGTQDPTTGNVDVTVSGVPNGTKVKLPGVKGEKVVTDGKVTLPNDELPETPQTGKGSAQEEGKLPKEGTSDITIPGKISSSKGEPEVQTETPAEIEITRKPNGDAVVTPKKPGGGTYPPGTTVEIPGENGTTITVTIGDNGSGEVPNDQLPKGNLPGKGTVTEPNKKPSQPVDVTTPARKTPTLDVERDPETGDVTVTPKKPDGTTYPPGTTVEIPGKDGKPITVTIGKDGKGKVPNSDLPDVETPGTGKITEPGKPAVEVPNVTTPAKFTPTTPTTETPGEIEITRKPNGNAIVTPKKPDGTTYPPGTKVEIPGENGTTITVTIGDNGSGEVPNDKLPKGDLPGKGTVTEPNKKPSQPVDVTTPARKTPTLDVERDPETGDVTVTPKKPDGSTYPPGTTVEIPGKDGKPITVTIGKDGKGKVPNSDLPDVETPGTGKITEPGKPAVEVPNVTTPAKFTPTTPTTETPGEIEITRKPNGDAIVTPKKPDGSTYPPGTTVEIPGENGTTITVTIGDNGSGEVPNDKLPKGDLPGKGTVTEPNKKPSQPVDVTTPARKTPTLDVERDPETGDVTVTPKKPDGSTYPPGTKVEIPGKDGKPITVTIGEDGKGKVPNSDLPDVETPGTGKITEPGKPAVEVPNVTTPAKFTPTTPTTETPAEIEITRKPNGDAVVTPKKPGGGTYPPGTKVEIPGENGTTITVTIGDNGSGEVPNDKLPKGDLPGKGTVTEPNKKPSQPVDVTTPARKTPTLDVERDPETGDVTVTPKKPDGTTYPPGTTVEIPGKDGKPITVTIGEDGKGKVPNSDLPDVETPGTGKITEPGKPAVEVPNVTTPAKVTPGTQTTSIPVAPVTPDTTVKPDTNGGSGQDTPAPATPTPNADQVDTKTTVDNGAKSNDSQNVLPNTGTESNATLASLGLLGMLGGLGLVLGKKKKTKNLVK